MWPLWSCSPVPGGMPPLEPGSLGEAKGPTAKRPIPLKEGRALARGILKFKSPANLVGRGVQKKHRDARWATLTRCNLKRKQGGKAGRSQPQKIPSKKTYSSDARDYPEDAGPTRTHQGRRRRKIPVPPTKETREIKFEKSPRLVRGN